MSARSKTATTNALLGTLVLSALLLSGLGRASAHGETTTDGGRTSPIAGLGRASVQAGTGADASPSHVDLAATLRPLPGAQAESRAVSGATGTFTARLTPSGSWFYRLSYRLKVSGLSGRATSAHVHLGRGARGGVVATLCVPRGSGSGRCALPALGGRIFVYERSLLLMRALGAYVDIHTMRHPDGELRGELIRPTPVWQQADSDSATGEWTTARVAATDRREPLGARMTLMAPKGRVDAQVLTECAQTGVPLHPTSVVNWRFVSRGRPIVRWLFGAGGNVSHRRECRWTVYALGGEGRMELALETLRSVEP